MALLRALQFVAALAGTILSASGLWAQAATFWALAVYLRLGDVLERMDRP